MKFIAGAYQTGGDTNFLSVWRYGVTGEDIFTLLRDIPPKLPPAPAAAVVSEGGGVYVVKAGDTLGGIADSYGVSVDDLASLNGIDDPAYIYVGQELKIPAGGSITAASAGNSPSPPAEQPAQTGGGATRTYTIQSGDTLYAVAGKFGTTVDAIVKLNGLTDPDVLTVGQVLKIP
jgi:LysM repeat protein